MVCRRVEDGIDYQSYGKLFRYLDIQYFLERIVEFYKWVFPKLRIFYTYCFTY